MRKMKKISLSLLLFLFQGCGEQTKPPEIDVNEIKVAYSYVKRLNQKLQNGESVYQPDEKIIGIDERNGLTVIQKKSEKCFGCNIYPEWYDIYYENLNEDECKGDYKVATIDYCGFAATHTYRGCSPDTTN